MLSEERLREFFSRNGIFLFSAGCIREIKEDFLLGKEMNLQSFDYAISFAYPLPGASLEGIKDRPTLLYKHIYRQVNNLLDRIGLQLAQWLEEQGVHAIPIPASQIIDWEKNLAHLSHRQVAEKLGMGFYGRNNLIVIPGIGSRARLATVLIDTALEIPGLLKKNNLEKKSGCGDCVKCIMVCPAQAINTGPQDFDRKACFTKVKEFEKMRGINVGICGICVKACSGDQTFNFPAQQR